MDQRVGSRIAFVLGEVEAEAATGYGHEPRKAWLELVLPLLLEPQPLVPPDSTMRILDIEHGHDFLIHAAEANEPTRRDERDRLRGGPAFRDDA